MKGTVNFNQDTTKLKKFMEEYSQLTQISPLSNLLSKSTEKCHLRIFNIQESPLASTINSFENESNILNQLSQIGSTPEKKLENNMKDIILQSRSKKLSKPRFQNRKHKRTAVSKISKPLLETYRCSNRNSIGTKKLEKSLKECSQKPHYEPLSCILNMPTNGNLNSITNPLKKFKNKTITNYKSTGKSLCDVTTSLEKSKIIHRRGTLVDYFKEIKNIPRSIGGRSISSRSSELHIFEKSSNSILEISNYSTSTEEYKNCARTRAWTDLKWTVLKKENRDKKKNKTITHNENEHSSPLYKGLNLVEEFNQEYEKQGKLRLQKLDQWLQSNPLQITSKDFVDCKNTLTESNMQRNKLHRKKLSEKFFKTKPEPLQILQINTKIDETPLDFHRKIRKENAKIWENKSRNKNAITRYFSKNKLADNKKHFVRYSLGSKKKNYSCLYVKETENQISEKQIVTNNTRNTTLSRDRMQINNDWLHNTDVWLNRNKKRQLDCLNEKHNMCLEKLRPNSMKAVNETHKNLYSSEGFFESMSLETSILKASDNKGHHLSQKYMERNHDSSRASNSQQIWSTNSSIKKPRIMKHDQKFKEGISSFVNSLCSQPKELPSSPKRTRLTLSEERELSPDYYVMKMCGPESAALVKSILNSQKYEDEKTPLNINTNEVNNSNNSLCLSDNSRMQKSVTRIEVGNKGITPIKLEQSTIKKNSPSDPLSFGSPSMTFYDNANFSQRNCTKLYQEDHAAANFLSSLHLDEFSRTQSLSQNQLLQSNSQPTQKKEKLNSQELSNLYKLHESNSWNTPEQSRNIESLRNSYSIDKNYQAIREIHHLNRSNSGNKKNTVTQRESTIKKSTCLRRPTKIDLTTKNSISSEIFATQDSCKVSQNEKNRNYIFKNDDDYMSTAKSASVSQSENRNDPFLNKLLAQNYGNFLQKNIVDFKLENPKFHENKENAQNSQVNVYHTKKNCERLEINNCHIPTNCEELGQETKTQSQADNFTQNIFGDPLEIQNVGKKFKKTYNISEKCILYKNNLLKSLIEEKGNFWKDYRKKRILKRRRSEEARSCIKRYKKGDMKIFRIKRRIKKKDEVNYKPPEGQIMDRFLKMANNDFKDVSSSNSESVSNELESVSTPKSYRTEETKSVALSTGSSDLTEAQKLLRQGINKLSKDKSLLFLKFDDSAPDNFDKYEIIANIEHIVNGVLDDFEQGRTPSFRVPKENISNCFFADGRYQMRQPPDYTTVSYKASSSRLKFNLILFLLNKIKTLLETDTKLTKRELYYQLKTMIKSQDTTDRALKDICRMLNVGLWALNVTAQKGLVYGNLNLVMADGETINCNVPGTLIPPNISKICEVKSTAYFILVVEKESIYHKLLEENLPNRLTRPFILITGKGFPDLNTQLFLKKLWMVMSIPVFILVDADPDGIAIMLNYRFGSIANAHVSEHLAIPKAKWLGVFPSEISRLNLVNENLSKRELSKTQKLLQLQCVQENENIKKEVEELLENGIKAGIEGLIKTETYLSNWYLSWKFYTNSLI